MTRTEPPAQRAAGDGRTHADAALSPALGEVIARALDHAGVGVTVLCVDQDSPSRIYANRAFADLLGYSIDDLIRLDPLEALPAEERARLTRLVADVQRGEPPPRSLQASLLARGGEQVPVEVSPVNIHLGGRPVLVNFFHDTSERVRVAAALRESEQRFRQLAEAAPDGIAVVRASRFLYVNPAVVRLHGYSTAEEMQGMSPTSLVATEQGWEMAERLERIERRISVPSREYRAYRKDGSSFALEASSIPIEFGGKPAVLSFVRDIDRRKRMESELLQADRLAAVGTLAAGVAHEVNNPLTYLLLNLKRLRQSLPDMSCTQEERVRAERLLDEALDGGERVRMIVRDLLTFARSDVTEGKRVDVAAVMDSTIKLAQTGLRRGARIVRHFEAMPPVSGSEARLGQVFLNLLINAAQAFEGREAENNEIRVSIRRADERRVLVQVADNGAGIPAEHLDRIFDPFFTTKPPGTGTGLGLSITRSIVESLNGDITLDSVPDRGTTVTVLLPLAD